MNRSTLTRTPVLFSLILLSSALAGPLSPPLGPVSSTHKTLSEIEPRTIINATNTPGDADSLFRITQPGSYYLTGNITGVANKHGIEIAASGVTIDLNGFEVTGIATPGFFFDGIRVDSPARANIAIRNGSVRSWSGDGINLDTFSAINCTVSDIRSSFNGRDGISVNAHSIVSSCLASLNGNSGITTGFASIVSNCSAAQNANEGINASVTNVVSNCNAYLNLGDGFSAGINSRVSDCVSYDNSGNGFTIGSGATITNSNAYANDLVGIELFYSSAAHNCSVSINTSHGITAQDRCTIVGNTISRNGSPGTASGIYVIGDNGRIEGNTSIENDRGIEIDGISNVVIRNTCAGNTVANWDIAANNVCGPILNRSAPASAAILGDSAPSSLGTTDANANFTH